jgi:hypothetical protein
MAASLVAVADCLDLDVDPAFMTVAKKEKHEHD